MNNFKSFRGWLAENDVPGGSFGTYMITGRRKGDARGCHDTDMYQVAGSCSNHEPSQHMPQTTKGGTNAARGSKRRSRDRS